MKSCQALIAASGLVLLAGGDIAFGATRAQPTAPPIPPSWRQPQPPPSQKQPPAQAPPAKPDTAKDKKETKDKTRDRNDMNQYPYGYYPGYGQPTAGVYYPGGSPSGTSGNPNAASQNNGNGGNGQGFANNNPPADKPAPTPVAQTPPTPPDPELISAQSDLNSAMDVLRQSLLKTNADYQAAVAAKKAAQETSASVHANENSTQDQILAAATAVLEASTRVTQIEKDAASTDPQVQDAQSKYKTALAAHAANAAAK